MKGIDYGMGTTNIDLETDVRYGAIPLREVAQAWSDSSELDYGDPTCPECGGECVEYDSEKHESYEGDGGDHACEVCERSYWSDAVYSDEPTADYINDGEYKAFADSMGDIIIEKSPYVTRAPFASPCFPGGVYLSGDDFDGELAYCFDKSWFDLEPCPYHYWRLSDGKLMYCPADYKDCHRRIDQTA